MKLSNAAKLLVVVLVAYLVLDFFLTPAGGLETRPIPKVTVVGFVTLGLIFVGLVLAILSIVLLFRRSPRAPIVAIVAPLFYFPAMLADQTGLFSSLGPPIAIGRVEWAEAVVALLAIGLGSWMLRVGTGRTTN